MVCIPEGTSTVANRAYLMDIRTGAWGERQADLQTGALVRDPETTTIDDLTGTIDGLTGGTIFYEYSGTTLSVETGFGSNTINVWATGVVRGP